LGYGRNLSRAKFYVWIVARIKGIDQELAELLKQISQN